MTKRIPYKTKDTSANTIYRQLSSLDRTWVLDHAKELIDLDDVLSRYNHPDTKALNKPNPKMPGRSAAHGGGRNSPRSMCQGTLDNFNAGQYDLSDKTMTGLTEAFRVAHELVEDFEDVEFYEVTSFKAPNLPKPEADTSDTTFSDLFSVESITVTYRRK